MKQSVEMKRHMNANGTHVTDPMNEQCEECVLA